MKLNPKMHVIYDGTDPNTYERVTVFIGITQFSYSKGFEVDISNAFKMANRLSPTVTIERDVSLDHFIMDAGISENYSWLLNATLFDGMPTKDFIDKRGLPKNDVQ